MQESLTVTAATTSDEECQAIALVDQFLADCSDTTGVLIPVLQRTQEALGYLPVSVLKHISQVLHVPYSEVSGVVTFYSFFSTVPRGKNVFRVCLGTACYVRGGKNVLEAIAGESQCPVGGTTDDREISLEIGRCFGACGLAPVVMVNDDVHQRVKPSGCRALLDHYREGGTS